MSDDPTDQQAARDAYEPPRVEDIPKQDDPAVTAAGLGGGSPPEDTFIGVAG